MNHVPLGDDVPGELICVKVPDWAGDIAVDGNLLAYSGCLSGDPSARSDWRRFDWIAVAWHMLNGTSERAHEQRNGPVLSYAFRLPEELHLLFDRAWANRIFLFLRRWAAREERMSEEQLFGTVPKAEIVLTHDVDAIRLTPEIRLKQTAFQLANALRSATHARFLQAGVRLVDAARFAFSPGDLRTIGRIREMEQAAGLRSVFHFYGGPAGWARRTPRRMLIDPGYDVGSPYVAGEIGALRDGGWQVGLHQSFEAWSSPASMERERQRVEAVSGAPVVHCRQHWLRFSWETTWRAQERAGLAVDSTLGFNDRPGFRAGHALRLFPWDRAAGIPMQLAVMPMVMMDSQFYDYAQLSADAAGPGMKRWIDEIRAVGGEASVNWHPHTITGLYGWGKGFEDLLGLLS
ncbi:MAG: hypothetical protein JJ913_14010 [Rhizobiaceae bacterium]|nr:hypothetical protein [Rhizobiaceae bacterium]